MRFNIPVTALITLLVSTGDSFAAATIPSPLNIQSNFSCNEPFMIPAEYIDPRGNSFAMCFSDPRFHHKNIIWYIQGMAGSFKAIGVASREGSHEFVGSVIPIEQPADRTGMHAEPVAVTVRLDRAAGVITVNPLNNSGTLVNWIIRPNGFPSGSLKVPHSCGPFLKPLENDELLAPLTGAGHKAKVCLIPRQGKGDAFISWGHYKHDRDNRQVDPIALDDGYAHKFFSVGFVGPERGVSIDICDPGNGDANRCEMSKLVGHTRKTFIVGSGNDVDLPKPVRSEIAEEVVKGPGRPRRHAHEIRSDALIKKVDMIERNIKSLLARSKADNVASTARRRHHRRDNIVDRPIERAACPMRRQSPREDLIEYPVTAEVKADYFIDRPVEIIQDEIIDRPVRRVRDELIDRPVEVIQDEIIERPGEIISDEIIERPIEQARRLQVRNELIESPVARAEQARRDILIDRPVEIIQDEIIERPADAAIDTPVERARRAAVVADPLPNPAPVAHRHRRRQRAKNCPINPLLYPRRPVQKAAVAAAVSTPRPFAPVVQAAPVVNSYVYRLEADTLAHYNRLRQRLSRLDRRLDNAESIIDSRLSSFNDWLHRQKSAMEDRAKDFISFLTGLKNDVVYTPKSKKKKADFLNKIGKAFRGAEKDVKSSAAKVKQEIYDPAANVVSSTIATSGNVLDNTVAAGGNVLDSTVVTAKRVVESPVSAVGNGLDATAGVAARTVNSVIDPVVRPIAPARAVGVSDRFDFNDDLLPPARAAITGPNRLVDDVIVDPLRPVGPAVVDRVIVDPIEPVGPLGTVDPLGPVGPVLPPPAVRQFNNNNNDPIRAAIDYLN